ncbi:glycosyltransferase family 4 protein [Neopusillimonas aromaticivorans]|uniref:glycosyltransferase family 4 protein n=1 Tax=Neopusillimonas aromaticivorans TaxID=2979868 RepID=UPI0025947E46|nr:glycosyltransferase [Neopusillimonas aromaticivorans]WJJ94697.1 glycosyltransferase [Neopusillimonas aromaticivorans]
MNEKNTGVLFLPGVCSPSNGGESRLFHFYRALSRWHQVTLLTSSHAGVDEERVNHGLNFVERRIPKDAHFAKEYARLESLGSGGDLSAPALVACAGLPTALHEAYLQEYEQADVIIHDFPMTVGYDLFAGLDDKPRIYNAHNCESELYRQLHPARHSQPVHELIRQAELQMLQVADLVLYCNPGDLSVFRSMAPEARFDALYAANGMQPLARAPSFVPGNRHRAVFMGSGHPPNVRAAQFIVQQLAPQLPEVEFDIIGTCLAPGDYPANVHCHGRVSDDVKARLLGAASIALNPMEAGSGSNVKVLDYFANALAVLSSDFGMRGIDAEAGQHYLQAGLDGFADALRQLLQQPVQRQALAAAGHNLALQQYTWEAISGRAAHAISALAETRTERHGQFVLALNDYDSFAVIGGGATRTCGLYAAASEQFPVVLVSFAPDGRLQVRREAEQVWVINVPRTSGHEAELLEVNAQHHVSADDIIAGRHCTRNPWLNAVYQQLRRQARCIVVEHCYMVPLPLAWGDRFVYSSQNHEALLKRRLLEGHPLADELVADVEAFERYAVECSAATVAVSLEDAESLVQGRRTAGPVLVVRNGASTPAHGPEVEQLKARLAESVGKRSVVFLGSAHMPNIEAARFITEQLAVQCTDVQFHLLGTVCGSVTRALPNVTCWGVVDDQTKSALMQSCALAINPMLSGSGSNVKLADYIGNGLYVVTTEFGQRGYPSSVRAHLDVVPLENLGTALLRALAQPHLYAESARAERMALFQRELSMQGLAGRFVELLHGLPVRRKRVLYVAYRYVAPALGGAELNIEKFVSALGHSGYFDVDVIAPEVSSIHNQWRFAEHYGFDAGLGVPVDIPHVRFARFPAKEPPVAQQWAQLRNVWQAQGGFEQEVSTQLRNHYTHSGLSWGWGYPEGVAPRTQRWAFTECGVYVHQTGHVQIRGYAPDDMVITALASDTVVGGPWQVNGSFELAFEQPAGELLLRTSAPQQPTDPRPLGFQLLGLTLHGQAIDLAAPLLCQQALVELPAHASFDLLDQAARRSRVPQNVRLTDTRGPWSTAMDAFLADHVADYDLVIAHNNVFRPAVVAMAEARKQGCRQFSSPMPIWMMISIIFPTGFKVHKMPAWCLPRPRRPLIFWAGTAATYATCRPVVTQAKHLPNKTSRHFARCSRQPGPLCWCWGARRVPRGTGELSRRSNN